MADWIIPGLHIKLGLTLALLNHLIDFLRTHLEKYPENIVNAQKDVVDAQNNVLSVETTMNEFDAVEGALTSQVRKLLSQLKTQHRAVVHSASFATEGAQQRHRAAAELAIADYRAELKERLGTPEALACADEEVESNATNALNALINCKVSFELERKHAKEAVKTKKIHLNVLLQNWEENIKMSTTYITESCAVCEVFSDEKSTRWTASLRTVHHQ